MIRDKVQGFGVNDAGYPTSTSEKIDGKFVKAWRCPIYCFWARMLERCFSHKKKIRHPTYRDCTICEDWKYFSNFRRWVLEEQPNKDWMDCELDKDLLITNNKYYGPETCAFVSKKVNNFLLSNTISRGDSMIGVSWHIRDKKFRASCKNPFTGRCTHVGYFTNELDAHKAWQAKKHEYACQLADLQDDPRVAKALRERYAPDKDWTNK